MKLLGRSAVVGLVYSVLMFAIATAVNPASAEPSFRAAPFSQLQVGSPVRHIGNSASAGACVYEQSGQFRCESVYFVESFTAKVEYEFTEVSIAFFENGPERNGNGNLHCYVPKDSLKVSKAKGATVDTLLDTASSLCDFNIGLMCDGESANCVNSPYSGVISVKGSWKNPTLIDETISSIKNRNLITGDSSFLHCSNYFGNEMREGSFAIADRAYAIDNVEVFGSFVVGTCIEKPQ